jgi:hypothetical protein
MHEMVEVSSIADEHLFHCPVPGCGRQVSLHRADLRLTVLSPGDVFARHTASTAPDIFQPSLG